MNVYHNGSTRLGRTLNRVNRGRLLRAGVLTATVFVFAGMDSASCDGNGPNNGNTNNNQNNNSTGQKPSIDPSRDHIMVKAGANPTVTVVEYADLQCPACGTFARVHLERLIRDYVDTGKIRYVYRHYPLNSHAQAVPSAEAAECVAAQDESKFFEFIDEIFHNQSDIYSNSGTAQSKIRTIAEDMGFDMTAFDNCTASDAKLLRVEEDRNSGNALGVQVTPTFFVEEQRIGQPGSTLQATVDALFDAIDRKLGE